jgi:Domain of unknown function (DUF4123)/FHA domain
MNEAPRAIVSVRYGPLDARRATVAPGGALRVGRTAPAALTVPHDRRLSGVHFELTWDGARGRLRDLASAHGTFLDGLRVDEAEIPRGAFVRAGDTLFSFHVEGSGARDVPPDAPDLAARKERARSALVEGPEPLFAVIDAARDARALAILRESVEDHLSLYDGAPGARMAEAAPYLVRLPADGALPGRLVREGWGQSWGIYLRSRRPFDEVRRHLRRLLLVDVEGRPQKAYFRFYDPRVLRQVAPMCNPRQAAELFGDVRCFLLEDARGEVLRLLPPGEP